MEKKEDHRQHEPANSSPPPKMLSLPHHRPEPQLQPLDSSPQQQVNKPPFKHLLPPAAASDGEVDQEGGHGEGGRASFKSNLWLCPPEKRSPPRESESEFNLQSSPLDSPPPDEVKKPPFKPTPPAVSDTVVSGPKPIKAGPIKQDPEDPVERGYGNSGKGNLKPNVGLNPPPEMLSPPQYSPETQFPPFDSPPLEKNEKRLQYKPASPPAAETRVATETPVTKVGPTAQEQEVKAEERGGRSSGRRYFKTNLSIMKRARRDSMVKRALLAFRICGFIFSLVSFSVLAADRNRGWALDSFYRYKEFRYIMAVNVIAFVYSGFQIAYQLAAGKRESRRHMRYHLEFSMDQSLTYLLLSASTSAAVRVDDWQSNWGNDLFPDMAKASVAFSFLTFVALALSSLVSGYTILSLNTL